MPKVAIVGAGLIGRSWANVFARGGWTVKLWDPVEHTLQEAPSAIAKSLADLSAHGLVDDPAAAMARVKIARSLDDAVGDADYVQENGPETLEAKCEIFAQLDRAAPETAVLASSTSAIVASKFTTDLPGRERCLVAHPVNPPHLVPVVEVCGAPWTSQQAKTKAMTVYRALGQQPIDVRKEVDGFVLNRLQIALLTEAFRLVRDGVVSPEDLDHTIADGLGLRWAFMGPFETIELNAPAGIADYCRRYTPWFRRYMQDLPPNDVWDDDQWQEVAKIWARTPTPDDIAKKSVWRNERLAALVAHKRRQPRSRT
jgi:3-hydroxyacyl-CoA dehydrogenase